MNTRRAREGSPLKQHRYASAPEYADFGGISGTAVAKKAAHLGDPRKASLLFFLQAMSLKEGGLRAFVRDLLDTFPERLGTRTMHKEGIKAGREYSRPAAIKIHFELNPTLWPIRRQMMENDQDGHERIRAELSVDALLAECEAGAEASLPDVLTKLCIDPGVQFRLPDESEELLRAEQRRVEYAQEEEGAGEERHLHFQECHHPCFRDLTGALLVYQQRYAERVRQDFVQTTIARQVWDTLDYCLATRRMALIEGMQGIGKSTAIKAWHEAHLGESRLVSLSGVANRTGVFKDIARACGLPWNINYTATDTQARVEEFLPRAGLVLIIDEAHFLAPGGERIRARPELIDWVDTALYNRGVCACLVSTPQFTSRLENATKRTAWNAAQFWRRVKRKVVLPEQPTTQDMQAVAERLLPEGSRACLKLLVGHALGGRFPMDELEDTVTEARYLARGEHREKVTLEDLHKVIGDFRNPTAASRPKVIEFSDLAPRTRRRSPAPSLPSDSEAETTPAPRRFRMPDQSGRTAPRGLREMEVTPQGSG
jgi:hypothetical protein